jgi:hypothetical protein
VPQPDLLAAGVGGSSAEENAVLAKVCDDSTLAGERESHDTVGPRQPTRNGAPLPFCGDRNGWDGKQIEALFLFEPGPVLGEGALNGQVLGIYTDVCQPQPG